MTAADSRGTICAREPREHLVHLPTPLETAPRLSDALGVRVLIKREDLAGLCVGGNKSRLMEFAIGALRAHGVDTVIATAATQSNKLRDVAAAAARAGLRAILLVPESSDDAVPQGNRLLFEVLGAEVRAIDPDLDDDGVLAVQNAVADEVSGSGGRPAVLDRRLDYGIHATIGYVDAAEELHRQLAQAKIDADHVYVTVGAGMTVSGLALGLKHLGARAAVTGVCVARPAAALHPEVRHHAERAARHLGLSTTIEQRDVTLLDDYLAPGYGVVTPALVDAVRTVARLHGMVVDPVYNAKTVLALIDRASSGALPRGDTVVLFNTGGGPAIYPHHRILHESVDGTSERMLSTAPRFG